MTYDCSEKWSYLKCILNENYREKIRKILVKMAVFALFLERRKRHKNWEKGAFLQPHSPSFYPSWSAREWEHFYLPLSPFLFGKLLFLESFLLPIGNFLLRRCSSVEWNLGKNAFLISIETAKFSLESIAIIWLLLCKI